MPFNRAQDSAAAAIFLAAKVEEFRVHIKDVMFATYQIRHKHRLVENSDVSVNIDTLVFDVSPGFSFRSQ